MQGFIKFNKGVLRTSWPVKVWLLLLVAANAVAPLFFLQRIEAQTVVATMMISATLMSLLTARFGFTRILGLGHILWVPMLAFLVTRLGDIPDYDAFGIWIRAVIVLNGISLVIDAIDGIRYMAGDREETVPGL
jgi:hypothetical protein